MRTSPAEIAVIDEVASLVEEMAEMAEIYEITPVKELLFFKT